MRAAVLRNGEIGVEEVPEPVPGTGQVLVRTIACGICGSDLHFRVHGARMVALAAESGTSAFTPDLSKGVVMGHEFVAEVLEAGPDTDSFAPGTIVTSIPALIKGGTYPDLDVLALGFSDAYPGGYAERMVLSHMFLNPVPNGLDPRLAALTEPMAVGLHAVNRSGIARGESALVLGCGPVGLSVIAALEAKGIETIVATDFSAGRRALATTMGAKAVADPAELPAVDAWRQAGGTGPLVLFEAVGIPGMLREAMREVPGNTRIVVVGVCAEDDTIQPIMGIYKELDIRFALAYDPVTEFAQTLTEIAEGRLDVAPLLSGEVGIGGVAQAFTDLADPEKHCKILVRPELE